MPGRSFVHLHCHSHYSLLDGASRIPELVAHVKSRGMNAAAITDHGNLYGAIEFYRECKEAGLNPVIGYEAYVAPGKRTDREQRNRNKDDNDDAIYHHLTLLAKNAVGFRNLIKMSSLAFLEGYHYKPRIDKELLEAHHEGIICLSGCAAAEFSDHILRDRRDEAKRVAEWFAKLFGKDFYIEIQNNGLPIQKLCEEGAKDIARQLGLPLVATSDAHYIRQSDAVAHDVLLCINTGRLRSNPKRFKFEGDQFHVRGPEEMYRLFPEDADAVQRSQEIADSVDIQLDFKKRHFPAFTTPAKKTPEDYLRELCEIGLAERYHGEPSATVRDRLDHELGIICRMGFASYFLIVWDFVRFAISAGIPAGARGSACGAIVSYLLKLSHVCPLEYDLLFER
ncbi:MAG: PHP domain-containing protein, partial [Gemmataceae bacterium]